MQQLRWPHLHPLVLIAEAQSTFERSPEGWRTSALPKEPGMKTCNYVVENWTTASNIRVGLKQSRNAGQEQTLPNSGSQIFGSQRVMASGRPIRWLLPMARQLKSASKELNRLPSRFNAKPLLISLNISHIWQPQARICNIRLRTLQM